MKSTIIVAAIILTSLIILNSCKDNGVEPQIEPGRRDYVWTEDTLMMGNERLTLTRIWANNAQDIWVLGFGTTAFVELWHYDGKKWENANEPTPLNIIQPKSIFGFSSNDVWMGTGENQMWHFNGTSWSLFQSFSLDGYDRITIENIFGKSRNDIYAIGYAQNNSSSEYKGIILHYDGSNWQFKSIENHRVNLFVLSFQAHTNLLFILGSNFDNGLFLDKIFTYDGNIFKEIVSSYNGYGLGNCGGEVYINDNKKIYKYGNNNLVLWKDFTGTNFMASIQGRNENDFINSTSDGIGHYNGKDYKTIYPTQLSINGYRILEKDIFVITQDVKTGHSIIIHGWLK